MLEYSAEAVYANIRSRLLPFHLSPVAEDIVVEALLERIRAAQIGGQNVYFRGFGSFVRRERAAKKARDISRNTTVLVPAHTVPAFKPSKAFVECLKK